jgi:hypothetical protein
LTEELEVAALVSLPLPRHDPWIPVLDLNNLDPAIRVHQYKVRAQAIHVRLDIDLPSIIEVIQKELKNATFPIGQGLPQRLQLIERRTDDSISH